MDEPLDSTRAERFRAHIERRYGVSIMGLERLDRGVLNIQLQDDRRWIARVFSAKRPLVQVEGDARILQFLAEQGFAAERCAVADPVFAFGGRSIILTEYIENEVVDVQPPMLHTLGAMLARLNLLPVVDEVAREAGALHHFAPQGGLEHELTAAAAWLDEVADAVRPPIRSRFDTLRAQLSGADTCHDLPMALIHADPVLKNVLAPPGGEVVFIDWTGAGRGPRIASLALFLWSSALLPKGGWSPHRVAAVVAGYRSHIALEPRELDRLAAVMQVRPLVFACWRFSHAIRAGRPVDGSEWWWPNQELVDAVAAHACTVFRGD